MITLFSLQIRFLSYQDEAITWWQRIAIYLDLLLVAILWPIILHKQDDWRSYWREVIAALIPRKRVWLIFAIFFAGIILLLFGASERIFVIGLILCLLTPIVLAFLYGWRQMHRTRLPRFFILFLMIALVLLLIIFKFNIPMNIGAPLIVGILITILLARLSNSQAQRGSFALLLTLFIVPVLPLAFMVDGEMLEKTVLYLQKSDADITAVSKNISKRRRLELREHALFAKPVKPETLAIIRSGKWQEGLKQVEPINLRGRSLRNAQMFKTVLVGANLWGAHLQGANLERAHLQGLNLGNAELQGANLWVSELQGANLGNANLQDANLELANLQGANLGNANLQGVNLEEADLQGVDLRKAQLQGITGSLLNGELVDLREVGLASLKKEEVSKLISELTPIIRGQYSLNEVIERLKQAEQPGAETPDFESCLASANTPVNCKKRYDPKKPDELKEFTKGLHTFLANLACESSDIAKGILMPNKVPVLLFVGDGKVMKGKTPEKSSRVGLDAEMKKRLQSNQPCPGLKGLSEKEKKELLKVEKQ